MRSCIFPNSCAQKLKYCWTVEAFLKGWWGCADFPKDANSTIIRIGRSILKFNSSNHWVYWTRWWTAEWWCWNWRWCRIYPSRSFVSCRSSSIIVFCWHLFIENWHYFSQDFPWNLKGNRYFEWHIITGFHSFREVILKGNEILPKFLQKNIKIMNKKVPFSQGLH